MSKGGLRDGTDVRRVPRQTGKEREVDMSFQLCQLLVLFCLMFARNHICVLINGQLPVTGV